MDLPAPLKPPALLALNELLFHVARAFVGAGAPVGLSDDVAAAVAWLAFIGHDPAQAALTALDALAQGRSSGNLVFRGNRIACRGSGMVSALFAGPVITDRLSMAPSGPVTFHVDDVDVPVLLAGAVAAAGPGHARLSWKADARTDVDIADGMVAIRGEASGGRSAVRIEANAPGACLPSAAPLHAIEEGRSLALDQGIAVDSGAWSGVLAYYARTLVPSTDRSRRKGAGPSG